MKKFYIIYKDTNHIEGMIECSKEEFAKRFVNDTVYSWHLFDEIQEELELPQYLTDLI